MKGPRWRRWIILCTLAVAGCADDDLAPYHPCAQRDAYARDAADAQGRYEYVKRRCEDPGCAAEYRALLRVLRRETDTFRRLTARADALCDAADG